MKTDSTGKLFIVATPIGNREDITLRALRTLREADVVAAEDTRHTGRLLSFHGIKARLLSFHEHNEKERTVQLIEKMIGGESVALVSDAGTPSISDPGYRLVKAAVENGIEAVPVPGASAAIAALSVSGLPSDMFVFVGFPVRKKEKRSAQIGKLASIPGTLVFYESPNRVLKLADELVRIMGDRRAVLCREMTKLHEEFIRGPLSEIRQALETRESLKGECVLLVEGAGSDKNVDMDEILNEMENELKKAGTRVSELSKRLAKKYGLPKKKIYGEALKIAETIDKKE